MVGHIIPAGQDLAEIVRHLARTGGVQVRIGIVAVCGVIDDLVHVDKVDVLHAQLLRHIVDGVGVGLVVLTRGRIRHVGKQHPDAARPALLHDAAQINEAVALFPGGIRDDGVLGRLRHMDLHLRAEIAAVAGMNVLLAQLRPAGVIQRQREDVFLLEIDVAVAIIVHLLRIAHQVIERRELGAANRQAVKCRVHIAAAAAQPVEAVDVVDVHHDGLGRAHIQRTAQQPVGHRQRVVVAGQVVGRDAVVAPQLQRIHRAQHVAVAQQEHVRLLRALIKGRQLLPALLALEQNGSARDDRDQDRAEEHRLDDAQHGLFHPSILLCIAARKRAGPRSGARP